MSPGGYAFEFVKMDGLTTSKGNQFPSLDLKNWSSSAALKNKMAHHLAKLQRRQDSLAQYPGVSADQLIEASYEHPREAETCEAGGCNEHLVTRLRLKQQDIKPRIHSGDIVSSHVVIESGTWRDRIAAQHGIVGFDMETPRVLGGFPCILVKGVCDYADGHRNNAWQPYAAATAAAAAKACLELWKPSILFETETEKVTTTFD
jgi:nucleoside phosphorylase